MTLVDKLENLATEYQHKLNSIRETITIIERTQTPKSNKTLVKILKAIKKKRSIYSKNNPHWTQTPRGRAIMRRRMTEMQKRNK